MEEIEVITLRPGAKPTEVLSIAFERQETRVLTHDLSHSIEENISALKFYVTGAEKNISDDFTKWITLFEYLGKIYYLSRSRFKEGNEILEGVTNLKDKLIEKYDTLLATTDVVSSLKEIDNYAKEELVKLNSLINEL